jgi:hypothetical protein
LAAARLVLEDEFASQAEVDAAEAALAAALEGLVDDPPPVVVMSQPVLSGVGRVGQVLSADVVVEPDVPVRYDWFRGTTWLSQASGPSYQLQVADAGFDVKVKTRVYPGSRFEQAKYSNAVRVADPIRVQRRGLPAEAVVGDSLVLDLAYTPVEAEADVIWFRNGGTVPSVSGLSYPVGLADSGGDVVVKIVLSLDGFDDVTVYSPHVAVAGPRAPAVTGVVLAPAGFVQVGEELVVSMQGVSEDCDVVAEWFSGTSVFRVDGKVLRGLSYTPVAGDVGLDLIVKVTVSRQGFPDAYRYSNRVVVAPAG